MPDPEARERARDAADRFQRSEDSPRADDAELMSTLRAIRKRLGADERLAAAFAAHAQSEAALAVRRALEKLCYQGGDGHWYPSFQENEKLDELFPDLFAATYEPQSTEENDG